MGLTLRRWGVATRGLVSAALGYLVLALSAALVLVVMRLTGVTTVGEFAHNHAVKSLAHPALRGVLLSACGALAGMVMLTSYRRYLLPGALIALLIIESAALVGASLAAGEPDLALGALGRFVMQRRVGRRGGGARGRAQANPRAPSEADGQGFQRARAEIERGQAKRTGLLAPDLTAKEFSGSCAVARRSPLIHNGATNGTYSPLFDASGVPRCSCGVLSATPDGLLATANFGEFRFYALR